MEIPLEPAELSEALRTETGLYLWCRRGLVITSFVSILCMQIVALYQMGLVKHLIEPPWRYFNADKVDAAAEAYHRMGLPMPDAMLGIVSYAVTVALVSVGGPDRFERWWWLPLLMGAKVLIDALQAGRLSWEQWAQHNAFCFWCLIAAASTFVAVPLAAPESWAAIKGLLNR